MGVEELLELHRGELDKIFITRALSVCVGVDEEGEFLLEFHVNTVGLWAKPN